MSVLIDIKSAEVWASAVLTGASLDEVRFSATYVLMRFISDRKIVEQNVYVDLEFYGHSDISRGRDPSEDLFQSRSKFFGEIHKFIGSSVESANLNDFGDLAIEISKSMVNVRASGDSVDIDDFYWSLTIEKSVRKDLSEYHSISCVLVDGGVAYFAK